MTTGTSVVDSYTEATTPGARLLLATLGIGLLAAVGSALVALGLTDVLAYANGYRPGHWIVASYATALGVMALGWSLFAGAVFWTARTVSTFR